MRGNNVLARKNGLGGPARLPRWLKVLAVLVVALALGGLAGAEVVNAASGEQYIGIERAKEIAFAHAKVSADSVRKLDIELDRDNGRMIYEIEFKVGRTEYEYEVDAISGEVLWWEIDRD